MYYNFFVINYIYNVYERNIVIFLINIMVIFRKKWWIMNLLGTFSCFYKFKIVKGLGLCLIAILKAGWK